MIKKKKYVLRAYPGYRKEAMIEFGATEHQIEYWCLHPHVKPEFTLWLEKRITEVRMKKEEAKASAERMRKDREHRLRLRNLES